MRSTASHNSIEQLPQRANQDPKISCPILCGNEMRATGLFYETDTATYLVTARHNILPAHMKLKYHGEVAYSISTNYYFPEVTVSLRDDESWTNYSFDLRDVDDTRVFCPRNMDVLAVPIKFDPEKHGYHVWSAKEVGNAANGANRLETIGYDTASFPDSTEGWPTELRPPRVLQLQNATPKQQPKLSAVLGMGLDDVVESGYSGLSGAPVVGESLVGIQVSDSGVKSEYEDRFDSPVRIMTYFSAELLTRHLP